MERGIHDEFLDRMVSGMVCEEIQYMYIINVQTVYRQIVVCVCVCVCVCVSMCVCV